MWEVVKYDEVLGSCGKWVYFYGFTEVLSPHPPSPLIAEDSRVLQNSSCVP